MVPFLFITCMFLYVPATASCALNAGVPVGADLGPGEVGPDAVHLMIGTQVAAEARRAVEAETGFQLSCGISHNVSP